MADSLSITSDEEILLKVRKHWLVLVRNVAGVAIFGVVPFVFFAILEAVMPPSVNPFVHFYPYAALATSVWLLVVWITLAAIWTEHYLDLWIVTSKRIISVDQIGIFNRAVTSLSLERIQEITVRQENALETLLHYGTIVIETAGSDGNNATMVGIPNPEAVRNSIVERLNAFSALSDANERQSKLIRSVSHEVKGYLAKDAATLASIAEGDYEKQPAMLRDVASSALSQTRKGVETVMNILSSADFDSGKITLAIEPFDITELVRTHVRESAFALKKRGLTLNIEAPHAFFVRGDAEKIGRLVIHNLIENAIHYTPGGSITISLSREGDLVRLVVSDTGIGISESDKEHLFTEGGKGEASSEINPESTGFGLFAAKEIVEAHGGRIWAESEGVGKGSAFIVELPAV